MVSGSGSRGGRHRRVFRTVVLGLCFTVSSCDDPGAPAPSCLPTTIGVLQGRVFVTGRPVSIDIGVRSVEFTGEFVAQTRSDTHGRYRLALPPAAYRIELNPESESIRSGAQDTVRVGPGVRNLDIRCGTLTVQVSIPRAPNGLSIRCDVDPGGSRTSRAIVANGRADLEFPIVWPGSYRLVVSLDGSRSIWLPGTSDRGAADVVNVGTARATTHRTELRMATISGTIRGSWQEVGASHPYVAAHTLEREQISYASCAADGSFTVRILDVQPVRLQVSIRGVDQWIGGPTFETARTYYLRPDQQLQGPSVLEGGILCQLEGPGSLSSYRPQALLLERSGRTFTLDSAYQNPFPICNLPSGSYRLYVHGDCNGEPWASQWFDGADSSAAATFIEVVAGHATPVTVHLDQDGRIEGRVLDKAGLPVSIRLAVYRGGTPLCDYLQVAGWNPFSIRGLGNGDYTLAAELDGSAWWYPGTARPDSAVVLRIRDHATLRGIEWRLPAFAPEVSP